LAGKTIEKRQDERTTASRNRVTKRKVLCLLGDNEILVKTPTIGTRDKPKGVKRCIVREGRSRRRSEYYLRKTGSVEKRPSARTEREGKRRFGDPPDSAVRPGFFRWFHEAAEFFDRWQGEGGKREKRGTLG